jgi:hypothetical protein
MKGETRKVYRALLSFDKSTIVSVIRWSFVHAGFFLRPENLLGPVGVNGTMVLERIEAPEQRAFPPMHSKIHHAEN